jgi:hypothetical protein
LIVVGWPLPGPSLDDTNYKYLKSMHRILIDNGADHYNDFQRELSVVNECVVVIQLPLCKVLTAINTHTATRHRVVFVDSSLVFRTLVIPVSYQQKVWRKNIAECRSQVVIALVRDFERYLSVHSDIVSFMQ